MSFYKTSMVKRNYNLQANNEDEEIVYEVITLLQSKGLTVDRSYRILEDAKTILPLITTLDRTCLRATFIDFKEWEKCSSKRTLKEFRGQKAVCGLNLSSNGGLTSLVLEFPSNNSKNGNKKYYIYAHSFISAWSMQEHIAMKNELYLAIKASRASTATDDIGTNYRAILAHLHNIVDTYEIDLIAIGYDPHNVDAYLQDLEDFGCDLIEIKQSARSLSNAIVDFRSEVKARNIEYDEDNKLLTQLISDAFLTEPNSFEEINIDKTSQKESAIQCSALICSHKLAMMQNFS